jgi:hypothetical protein
MPPLRRLLAAVAGALALVAYVWVAGVQAAGRVKRRKRLRREQ